MPMKKRILNIPLFAFLGVFLFAIIGVIIGSFLDFKISNAFVDIHDGFGAFIETIGEGLIAYGMVPFGAAMCFVSCWNKKAIGWRITGIIIILLAIGVNGYILGESLWDKQYSPADWNEHDKQFGIFFKQAALAFAVGYLWNIVVAVITFFLLRQEGNTEMFKAGLIIVLAMLVQFGVMHLLKRVGGRPRFRALIDQDTKNLPVMAGMTYKEWWEFAWFKNPSIDYFKSWPSGHSATAACAIFLPLIAPFLKWQKKHTGLVLFIVGEAYALLIMIFRVRVGAHFVSDVSMGLLVGTLCCFLVAIITDWVFKKIRFKKKSKDDPII